MIKRCTGCPISVTVLLFGAALFLSSCSSDEIYKKVFFVPDIVAVREGEGEAVVKVKLSSVVGEDAHFYWSTEEGTAVHENNGERGDFAGTYLQREAAVVEDGEQKAILRIPIHDDIFDEVDQEHFTIVIVPEALDEDNQDSVRETRILVQIVDDDGPPRIAIQNIEVDEGDGEARISYSLTSISGRQVHFFWQTMEDKQGGAIGGRGLDNSDFLAVAQDDPIIIPEGISEGHFTIPIHDDLSDEEDESFRVVIDGESLEGIVLEGSDYEGGPTGKSDLEAVVVIKDDDPPPTLILQETSAIEGGRAAIVYRLSQPSGKEMSFVWSTADGIASSTGGDFTAVDQQAVTIPPGTPSGVLYVDLARDSLDEPDEAFRVIVDSNSLVNLADAGHTLDVSVTIVDQDQAPTITLTSKTIDEDGGSVQIPYHLSQASGKEISFTWSVADGTAKAGDGDYTAMVGVQTVRIPIGQTRGTLAVPIIDDSLDELEEVFSVSIAVSSLSNLTEVGSTLQAMVTITDNDQSPTLSLTGRSVIESHGVASVHYALSTVSGRSVSFVWSTRDGTAKFDKDYTQKNNLVQVIPAGSKSGSLEILIVSDDQLYEGEEDFSIVVAGGLTLMGIEASGSSLQAIVSITDSDAMPTITLSEAQASESQGTVRIPYTLSTVSSFPMSFTWSTRDGSALSGADDFTEVVTQLEEIQSRSQSGFLTMTLGQDGLDENDENFEVVIARNSLNGLAPGGSVLTETVTITDSDAPPTISLDPIANIQEGGSGYAEIRYTLGFAKGSGKDIVLSWSTQDITAISSAGGDYAAVANQPFTIPAGTVSGVLGRVNIHDDQLDELAETFSVSVAVGPLSNLTEVGSTLRAIVTITDNDESPILSLTGRSVNESQGVALVQYALSAISGRSASFVWSTRDGTAKFHEDYTRKNNLVQMIPAGTKSGSLEIPIVSDDHLYEGEESFSIVVAGDSTLMGIEASGSSLQATVTISDSDAMPTITLSEAQASESQGTVRIPYTLSTMSSFPMSFTWSTRDGSALSGADDFSGVVIQLEEIQLKTQSGFLTITLGQDGLDENDENFEIIIAGDSLNGLAPGGSVLTETVTITDSDAPPTISLDPIVDIQEGGSGYAEIHYTLGFAKGSGKEIALSWSTQDITAISGDGRDYTAVTNQSFTIPAGTVSGVLGRVNIHDDQLDELEEKLLVMINGSSLDSDNILLGTSILQRELTILDNNPMPTISLVGGSFSENSGEATVQYSLSAASGRETRFRWSTVNGTAVSVEDYVSQAAIEQVIPAGERGGSFTIALVSADNLYEGSENFSVVVDDSTLMGIVVSGEASRGTIVIIDSDSMPTISLENIEVSEVNQLARVRYSISLASSLPMSFEWSTQDHTATSISGDFDQIISASESIAPKTIGGELVVTIHRDGVDEDNESFQVLIGQSGLTGINPSGSTLTGEVTITDGDGPPTISFIDTGNINENVGIAMIRYRLSAQSGKETRLSWATGDGSAKVIDGDYSVARGDIVIPAGTSAGTLSVPIIDDALDELEESFWVRIDTASLVNIETSGSVLNYEVTIADNDESPSIELSDAIIAEDGGEVSVSYRIAPVSGREVSFTWSTRDDSARDGEDYNRRADIAERIPAGTERGILRAPISILRGSPLYEGTERFQIVIDQSSLNGLSSTLGILESWVTITDSDSRPTVTMSDVSVAESRGRVRLDYTITPPSSVATSFYWSTVNGTAIRSYDFTDIQNRLESIAAKATSGSLMVSVSRDGIDENNENFQVVIAGGTMSGFNGSGGDLDALVTITDSDNPPTISLNMIDSNVLESSGMATVSYELSAISEKTLSFSWLTADGSAKVADGDYTATNGTVNIPINTQRGTLSVPIIDDSLDELDENFWLRITGTSLVNISAQGSTLNQELTIVDNEEAPAITLENVSVREDAGEILISYSINSVSGREMSFTWSTQDDTALSGEDYQSQQHISERIPAGTERGTLRVPISILRGTPLHEGTERFAVVIASDSLSGLNSSGGKRTAVVTITDSDSLPVVSVSDMSIAEAAGQARVSYTVSPPSSVTTSFYWSTIDGSAVHNDDFGEISNLVEIIPAKSTGGHLEIVVNRDGIDENDENFQVGIVNSTLAGIDGSGGDLNAIVTLTDIDDPPTITLSAASARVSEGVGTVAISYELSAVSGKALDFTWSTQNGTAKSGQDYDAIGSSSVNIQPGTLSAVIGNVTITNDTLDEWDESFQVAIHRSSLGNDIKPNGSDFDVKIIITDDDLPPTISVQNTSATEISGEARVPFTLGGPSSKTISFTWSTIEGTAKAGDDYTAQVASVVEISPGDTSGHLIVPIVGDDNLYEGATAETFQVELTITILSGITQAGSNTQATISIVDREGKPVLKIKDGVVNEDDGQIQAVYTLSHASSTPMSFVWSTVDDSAVNLQDYTALLNQMETIVAGTLGDGKLNPIAILNDNSEEADAEKFKIVVATGASLVGIDHVGSSSDPAKLEANINIVDDDHEVGIQVEDIELFEGNDAVITFTLSEPAVQRVSFTWSTRDGSAKSSAGDYTPRSNVSAEITVGNSSGTLRVPVLDDNASTNYEPNEIFTVEILVSSIVGANVSSALSKFAGTVKILANDHDETDQFTQRDSGDLVPVDIVWMIDSSGSAESVRQNIRTNLSDFISSFASEGGANLDFNMAILSTGTSQNLVTSDFQLNLANFVDDEAVFIQKFQEKVSAVGGLGFSRERPFRNTYRFLQNNPNWLRTDAYLALVYVSSEDEDSFTLPNALAPWDGGTQRFYDNYEDVSAPANIAENNYYSCWSRGFCIGITGVSAATLVQKRANVPGWIQSFRALKTSPGLLKIYPITQVINQTGTGGGVRFADAVSLTGGSIGDVEQDDFSTTLQNFGLSIYRLSSSFVLEKGADPGSIQVWVRETTAGEWELADSDDWQYDASTYSVSFPPATAPPAGASVEIKYQIIN